MKSIFDLYTQSERTLDRARGGMGIGLALVRRLVELHGGTIVASSDGVGCGSTFTFRLRRIRSDQLIGLLNDMAEVFQQPSL